MLRIFAILLLLVPLQLQAELYSSKINFQHVLDNRDVVLGVILSIHQDNDGFIWFGGENGLVRFDGYVLKALEYVEGDGAQAAKPLAMVADIFEDSKGNIWAASGNGLFRYDRKLERLMRLPDHANLAASPLSAAGVRRIDELANGKIAATSYGALYIVDPKTGDGKIYRTASGFSPGRINTVYHEQDNIVWVGTGSGLDRLDTNTDKITQFKPYAADPKSVPDNGVVSLVPAGGGSLWLGTDRGLILFNPDTQAYKRYAHEEQNPASFSGGDIWDLFLGADGQLWIATDGGGLNLLDPVSGKFVHFQYEAGRASSLNSSVVRTVMEDKNGDVWVGNYPGGVNFFDKSSAAIVSYINDPSDPLSLSYNSVMSVVEDRNGNVWVGTDAAGLNYFDQQSKTFIRYPHVKSDPNSISANAVLSMLLDSQNILWGGTWAGGIFQIDLNNGNHISRMENDPKRVEASRISHSSRLNNDKVWCIVEDRQGFIWIGTHEGGLSRYDRQTGEYTHYVATEEPTSIPSNQVWTVFEDSTNALWVGTTSGVGILNRDSGEFSNFPFEEGEPGSISNPSVLSIFEDSKNRIWLGTNAGLNLYHRDTNQFSVYGLNEGFFNDSIRSIIEDLQGRLWLGTNSGVIAFDPDSEKVKNYNRESGRLVGGFNYNAALMTQSGQAVFGGKKGFRIYDTQMMQDNLVPPPVVLTDFKLLSDSVKIGGADGILSRSVNFSDLLVLDYTDTVFEFEFAALNFRDQGKNRYAYMLEGFDQDWVNAGDQRRAKYTNLDAGTYTFRVKGSNNDGVWNETGKSIRIIQRPPPWQTWWAYTLYCVFALAIVLWFVQAQRKKRQAIEEQNRILERKVAERTAELSKKNKDIESMLANMHQGLFTIEGDGNIHPEYSRFLQNIFETSAIGGRNVIDLLFANTNLGSDLINQNQEAIAAIVGEDEMNFSFNSHLLVTEYESNFDDRMKNLSVDWNPIVVGDEVIKLMVTVRDITELKKMEAESKAQQRELDIISQLLNVPAKKYISFEKSAQAFLDENRQCIEANAGKNDDAIALLFRNMHTLKGNCRTFSFTHIGNVVHDVETAYSELKKSTDAVWKQQSLLDDIQRVEATVLEYGKVYREVLGRSGTTSDRASGMWLDASVIKNIQENIQTIQSQVPAVISMPAFTPIRQLFNTALTSPLDVVLADIVNSLPAIASELGKANPIVKFDGDPIRIKESANELLTSVFSHLLRNCVDHGIEMPEEREAAGKPAQGMIQIHTVLGDTLAIHVKDDGRGVNLDQLYKKGLTSGRWQDGDRPSAQAIAALIFESGVSTKDEVSEISGRGVGMDAVRQFMQDQGGDIRVELLAQKQSDSGCVAVEMVLELPAELYLVVAPEDAPVARDRAAG